MTETLTFPPLMWDEAANGPAFDHAVMRAVTGCDAGLIAHRLKPELMQAALASSRGRMARRMGSPPKTVIVITEIRHAARMCPAQERD